jgi:hypothetical protein
MSIFASQTQSDPIPIPFDPPHWIQVRKLTGREHERAQEAHRDGLALGRANVWSVFLRRALEKGASNPEVLKAIRDPLTGYDRYALVRAGLVAWSYPQPIKPEMVPATSSGSFKVSGPDPIDDLDDEAVDFIATEVLRRTKPLLFAATEEDAAAAARELQAAAPVA